MSGPTAGYDPFLFQAINNTRNGYLMQDVPQQERDARTERLGTLQNQLETGTYQWPDNYQMPGNVGFKERDGYLVPVSIGNTAKKEKSVPSAPAPTPAAPQQPAFQPFDQKAFFSGFQDMFGGMMDGFMGPVNQLANMFAQSQQAAAQSNQSILDKLASINTAQSQAQDTATQTQQQLSRSDALNPNVINMQTSPQMWSPFQNVTPGWQSPFQYQTQAF